MNALHNAGCNSDEKLKARKIIKIYLDGKTEINEQKKNQKNKVNDI